MFLLAVREDQSVASVLFALIMCQRKITSHHFKILRLIIISKYLRVKCLEIGPWIFALISHARKVMAFHWSLSDSKCPQVSRTLLNIRVDFSSAVVEVVLVLLISGSLSLFIRFFGIVPRAKTTIGITVIFYIPLLFHIPGNVQVIIIIYLFIY